MQNTHKEYRIVGKWGQWGDIVTQRDHLEGDLVFIAKTYGDEGMKENDFHIQERDVSDWIRKTS